MRKKLAALGLTAGLLGGGAAGFVLGHTGRLGRRDRLRRRHLDQREPTAAHGVRPTTTGWPPPWRPRHDGTITQAQADAVAAALQAARPGPGMRVGHLIADLDTAAQAIGIDADALHDALQDGQTLAEVAQANGVEPQTVSTRWSPPPSPASRDDVSAGRLSQDEADRLLADLESHITDLVNGVVPQGPPDGAPGFPGPMGAPGAGRVLPCPAPSTSRPELHRRAPDVPNLPAACPRPDRGGGTLASVARCSATRNRCSET